MTLDGYPYYNPAAVPFCLEQPLGMPEEENFRQRKLAEKNPLLRLHPGSKASDTFAVLFESALTVHFANWTAGNGTRIYGYCWCLWPNIVSRQASPKRK